jgi:hypothetical protein
LDEASVCIYWSVPLNTIALVYLGVSEVCVGAPTIVPLRPKPDESGILFVVVLQSVAAKLYSEAGAPFSNLIMHASIHIFGSH